jgi:hypothetical protein
LIIEAIDIWLRDKGTDGMGEARETWEKIIGENNKKILIGQGSNR